jgi:phenylacetate-CoA oxygenase PaaI subunit
MKRDATAPSVELGNLIASLADNKYFLGRRYAEWCTSAPALEAAVAAAAMAQDEIGHARSLYPLLREVAGTGPEMEPETRTGFTHVPFLRAPFANWTDFVAANFLFDSALSVLLDSARESALPGLAQRARRILPEERMHRLHGEGWVRRLAGAGPGVRDALLRSFAAVGPDASAWLNIAHPSLVDGGILSQDAESLRARYRAQLDPLLSEGGLRLW